MSTPTNLKKEIPTSILAGIARGVAVQALIYPLEVIKNQQQIEPTSIKSYLIAKNIFQKSGISGFYSGVSYQLKTTLIKQTWVWPLITTLPFYFGRAGLKPLEQQAATALSIALCDAFFTLHLDRCKFARQGNKELTLRAAIKEGWQGFSTLLPKRSVEWTSFLVAQKYLRDRAGQPLNLSQKVIIAAEVSLLVNLVSHPFDTVHTNKQAKDRSFFELLSKNSLRVLYRGGFTGTARLLTHNIASIYLLDLLDRK